MKVKKRVFVTSAILFLFVFIYLCVIVSQNTNNLGFSIFAHITFLVNIIVCCIFALADIQPLSLNKIFLYFNLFFLIIAPFMQYLSGFRIWNYSIDNNTYAYANILILLWILVFELCYHRFSIRIRKKRNTMQTEITYDFTKLCILLILTVICFAYMVKSISFAGLFIRSSNYLNIDSAAAMQIIMGLCRSVPLYATIYAFRYSKQHKNGYLFFLVSLVSTILLNFPTSVARYWLAIVYIGLLLTFFEKKLKDRTFDFIIIVIFIIVFPVFQLFKWYGLDILSNADVIIGQLSSIYNNADFDAYSMFARTIIYVKENGFNFGSQLLSIIFFIIPRSIWPSKPYPTGQLISSSQGQDFTNLSCPMIAEGYFAFGIIGVVLFAFIFSYVTAYFDVSKEKNDNNYSIVNFIYPFLFGVYVYIQRGSVQPAVVYTFSFYVFLIICYCCKKFIKLLVGR